ncbi:MAG: hypothetical protein KBD06_01305 [Candidatus Pacebacteria bacterium]|nr:hypothetical protein [Candidatus Paceibacterota bacterium]
MFRATTFIAPVLAGMIMSALLLGGPAHALISHSHGDSHDHGTESSIWQSLHASLRHEEKQVLPVFNMLVVIALVLIVRRVIVARTADTHVDSLMDHVRRGVAPYRTFS